MNRIRLLAAVAAIVAAAARPTEAELILAQTDFGIADGTDVRGYPNACIEFSRRFSCEQERAISSTL
jgi:hypothetical protein